MSKDIRARAEALAIAYASARTEQHFTLEDQIKLMSARIFQAGDEIITERGWNPIPDSSNFAWQLRGIDSENAQSLRLSAQTGKPVDLMQLRLHTRRRGQQVRIAEFADVPDIWVGSSPEQSTKELMFDLFVDLTRRLGFISDIDDLQRSPRVTKPGKGYVRVIHPTQPFYALFCDNSRSGWQTQDKKDAPEEIEIKEEIRELIPDFKSQFPEKHFPIVTIQINLYHQEKVRGKII
ncbi:MAG: hypothetical protein Q8P10_02415 [bacterium]|nr:hypothetical protein [bacterium]